MAISLLSECDVPEKFHISFTNDDNDSNLSASAMRCPLCDYSKRHFHCRNCIRKGDFIHSTHHIQERFSEKQLRYGNLQSAHATLENKCVNLLKSRRLSCQLRAEIKQRTENISNIRKLMALKRETVGRLQAQKKQLHETNRFLVMKMPHCDNQVKSIQDNVLTILDECERRRATLTELQSKLKQLRREQINKLIRYVFPISQAISNKSSFSSSDSESKNIKIQLSDASKTLAYVHDKWILQESFGDIQHIIVAPALPGNGDYSAYNDWATINPATDVASGRSEDPARTMASRNPAHTIAAALTYTAQLVSIMCFYLDICLPYKVSYEDFCTTALSEAQFNRKVARLNANILYLCYTQGCRLNELRPTHTLENVQRLMNSAHADLGRFGPVDRNYCLAETTNAALTQYLGGGDDSDTDDDSNQDWEAVPSNLIPPVDVNVLAAGSNPLPYGNTQHYQQQHHRHHYPAQHGPATSLMTSAVASVTSFWKGWTGGK